MTERAPTDPPSPPRRKPPPALVLGILGGVVLIVALLTPETLETSGKGGLTTHATAPGGAGIVYELARRLGWHVTRREAPLDSIPADTTIQALLDPGELSAPEAHRLLEGVRRGGALLLVGDVPALIDSVHYGSGDEGIMIGGEGRRSAECKRAMAAAPLTVSLVTAPIASAIVWRAPPPSPPVVLGQVMVDGSPRIAAEGVQLGAGRIGIMSTRDMASNIAVRACGWNLDADFVRTLEYLSDGPHRRTLVVFDEYDHGYGLHPGAFRAMGLFVERSPVGRALLQAAVGGLILLLAAAPRPIPPRDPERIARRSPLEQADALANAYASVRGTRTVAMRLLGGVRRRARNAGISAGLDDDAFLGSVASMYPARASDVALIRGALRESIPDRELPSVGEALERIEHALSPVVPPSPRAT